MEGGILSARSDFSFPCPCGGTGSTGYDEHNNPLVLHSFPTCVDFDRMDAHEYLVFVRKSAGIVAPWDKD